MKHIGCAEIPFLEWHRKSRRLVELDAIVQPYPFAQAIARLDIIQRQIDAANPALVSIGHKSRRPAQSATDIEYVIARVDATEAVGLLGTRRASPALTLSAK